MRDKLIQYIDLLFADAPATAEIADLKEELTRNTLDRYDDLLLAGKSAEAAYNLAVTGIGDINELLQQMKPQEIPAAPPYTPPEKPEKKKRDLPALGRWLIAIVWLLTVPIYLGLSFASSAWNITWLLFLIAGALSQVIRASFDLSRRVTQFVLSLVVLVLLSAAFFEFLPNGESIRLGFSRDYLFEDSAFNIGGAEIEQPVSTVDIAWINGSVTVEYYDGTAVRLQESDGLTAPEQLRWRLQDGKLTVFPRRSFWFFGLFYIGDLPEKNLTLQLPAGTILNRLEINAVSAAVDLAEVTAKDIKVEQVSGNTALRQVSGNDLELDTTSGQLECTDCTFNALNCTTVSGKILYKGTLSELEIDAVSGDSRIESDQMLQDINCDSVSGDFRLTMPDGSGFRLEKDSVSGDLKSDFPLSSAGDEQIYGNGSAEYSFDTVSGNIYLEKK